MLALEGVSAWVVGATCVLLALVLQVVKEGGFRRNNRHAQEGLIDSSGTICARDGTPSSSVIVIPCDRGPYPPLVLISLVLDFLLKPRAIIFCDPQLVLVGRRVADEVDPLSVIFRGGRQDVHIQGLSGFYGKVEIGGETLWVERRYFEEVRQITIPPW